MLMHQATASRRFAKFIAVGGIGFLVDAGVLTLAVGAFGASVYPARALSFSVAVFATWLLNRTFVFDSAGRRAPVVGEYSRYLVTQVIAAFCNLAVFAALIEVLPRLATTPVVPLAAGAVLGAFVNYGGSAWWVFRHKPRPN
jgi:putative flippase GtrA